MFIFIALAIAFVFAVTVMGVYELIAGRVNRIRSLKEYANLPKQFLWSDMIRQDVYSEQYHDLRQLYGDDRAGRIVIRRMLRDMKILKYRKEKL